MSELDHVQAILLTEIRDLLVLLVKQGAKADGLYWETEEEHRARITEDLSRFYGIIEDNPDAAEFFTKINSEIADPETGRLIPIEDAVERRLRKERVKTHGYMHRYGA